MPRRSWHLATVLASVTLCAAFALVGCASSSTTTAIPNPTASPGALKISVEHPTYLTSEPIGATVTNSGQTDAYAVDGHFACTIISLQRYDTKTRKWVSLDTCPPTHNVQSYQIPRGLVEPFTLAPTSPTNANTWDAGTYRVALTYSGSGDGKTNPITIYSAGFTVKP